MLVDTFSLLTFADLVPSDDADTLRNIICRSVSIFRPSPQTVVLVRSDNASGFKALLNDNTLSQLNIIMEYGRRHNKNKNPVVDKVIRELVSELLRLNPAGGQTNDIELSHAVSQLNARVRGRGLSSWEVVTQRDATTGVALDLNDELLSQMQKDTRVDNQISSAQHKASGGPLAVPADISVGSLVYIKDDKSKLRGRERYIVVAKDGTDCTLKKLLKSTLRNQNHKLKTTEIFPVSSNVVRNESYLRGWDGVDDEDEEFDVVEVSPSVVTPVEESPSAVSPFQYADTASVPEDSTLPTDVVDVTTSIIPANNVSADSSTSLGNRDLAPPQRKSARARQAPPWQKDYSMR